MNLEKSLKAHVPDERRETDMEQDMVRTAEAPQMTEAVRQFAALLIMHGIRIGEDIAGQSPVQQVRPNA